MESKFNIIVTGANGFIGDSLVQHFIKKSTSVTALVRKLPIHKTENVNYIEYKMEEVLSESLSFSNSIIIHCAYCKTKSNEKFDINEFAAKEIIHKAKKEKAKQVIFLSSISAIANSQTYYSLQKNKLEEILISDVTTILRPGLVIGKGGLFYKTILFIKKYKILPLVDNGKQLIYYIGINDMVKCIDEVIDKKKFGKFNLCNAKPLNYKLFYKLISNKRGIYLYFINLSYWLLDFSLSITSFLFKKYVQKDTIKGLKHVPKLNKNQISSAEFSFRIKNILEIIETDTSW